MPSFFNNQRRQLNPVAAPFSASSNSTVATAFLITGIAFLLVCLLGWIFAYAMGGISSLAPSSYSRSDIFLSASQYSLIKGLAIAGIVLILVSSIASIFWVFKITTASMPFILAVFGMYVVGNGIGFGMLFLVLQVTEAMAIFGIGGGIFLAMAAIGYFFKNLGGLWKFLIAGSIAMLICWIVSLVLYFTGVYSQTWVLIVTILSGLLFMGYTVYDVWIMRRMAEWDTNAGTGLKNRIAWFFGFKLLTDLLALIRIVARVVIMFRS